MSRIWFAEELETVATFWRVLRRDGIVLGFTSHDRDLWFGGILHAASPGMVPSAIRKSADFEPDSAEVEGALCHDSISTADLAAGRFDGAQVRIGVVDWETGENAVLYAGSIGTVAEEDGRFSAELVSRKAELLRDPTPRTSPTCRAAFCGPGCGLSAARFTHEAKVTGFNAETNAALFDQPFDPGAFAGGLLHWFDGPEAGSATTILGGDGAEGLILGSPISEGLPGGCPVRLREGCDHTLETCATRFTNAANFQGEPYLPGNDLLTRYPSPPK